MIMNRRKGKIIAFILLILWMIVIFAYSAMPADISDEKSRFVVMLLSFLGLNTEGALGNIANYIVRKGAHFTEYAILFLLAYNLMRYYVKLSKALLASLLLVFFYACTDEIHQLFVPGRAGRFSDVLIDTAGGAFAMMLTYIFYYLQKKKRRFKRS